MSYMKKIIPLSLVVFGLGLTGCVASGSEPASQECTSAVAKLKAEADQLYAADTGDTPSEVLNAPELYPLEACADFAEYSQAGIKNPGAWGMEDDYKIDMESTVITACFAVDEENSTPVCADAKALGLLGD